VKNKTKKKAKSKKQKSFFFLSLQQHSLTRHVGWLIPNLRDKRQTRSATNRGADASAHVDQFELAQVALVLRARFKVKQRHKVHCASKHGQMLFRNETRGQSSLTLNLTRVLCGCGS
jgi:hypothetical protein